VAEWLCSGLQSRGRRFDSDLSLHIFTRARVAELVDARDLKSLDGNIVPVQVRPRVPFQIPYAVNLAIFFQNYWSRTCKVRSRKFFKNTATLPRICNLDFILASSFYSYLCKILYNLSHLCVYKLLFVIQNFTRSDQKYSLKAIL
jgi:hypothetical protein